MESQKPVPKDILLFEIFPKLPTKSIVRFKCVSKTWLYLISQHSWLIERPGSIIRGEQNRLFFLEHKESNLVEIDTSYMYMKNLERVVLIGSCNGVVCLKLVYSDHWHDLVLWNPATREVNHLDLPIKKICSVCANEDCCLIGYALGFHARSGDHKVVWLKAKFGHSYSVEGQILSKKTSRHWRDLKSLTGVSTTSIFLTDGDGLSVDGAIYWRAAPFKFLSFDLSKEEFREFDGPLDRTIMRLDKIHFELVNWKGSMGVVFVVPTGAEIQVWLKNKDSDNSDSGWTKISTFQPPLAPILFGRAFSGHIIDIYYRDNSGAQKEFLYDLVTEEKREIGCLEKIFSFRICDHFYTMISPY